MDSWSLFPEVDSSTSISLKRPYSYHGVDVVVGLLRYECWSCNTAFLLPYPGICASEEYLSAIAQGHFSGIWGRYEFRLTAQVLTTETVHRAFVAYPSEEDRAVFAEYKPLSEGSWLPEQGVPDPGFRNQLHVRADFVLARLADNRSREGFEEDWVPLKYRSPSWFPVERLMRRLATPQEYADAVQQVAHFHRCIEDAKALSAYIDRRFRVQLTSDSNARIEPADTNIIGGYIQHLPPDLASWLLEARVPAFFVHKYQEGVDFGASVVDRRMASSVENWAVAPLPLAVCNDVNDALARSRRAPHGDLDTIWHNVTPLPNPASERLSGSWSHGATRYQPYPGAKSSWDELGAVPRKTKLRSGQPLDRLERDVILWPMQRAINDARTFWIEDSSCRGAYDEFSKEEVVFPTNGTIFYDREFHREICVLHPFDDFTEAAERESWDGLGRHWPYANALWRTLDGRRNIPQPRWVYRRPAPSEEEIAAIEAAARDSQAPPSLLVDAGLWENVDIFENASDVGELYDLEMLELQLSESDDETEPSPTQGSSRPRSSSPTASSKRLRSGTISQTTPDASTAETRGESSSLKTPTKRKTLEERISGGPTAVAGATRYQSFTPDRWRSIADDTRVFLQRLVPGDIIVEHPNENLTIRFSNVHPQTSVSDWAWFLFNVIQLSQVKEDFPFKHLLGVRTNDNNVFYVTCATKDIWYYLKNRNGYMVVDGYDVQVVGVARPLKGVKYRFEFRKQTYEKLANLPPSGPLPALALSPDRSRSASRSASPTKPAASQSTKSLLERIQNPPLAARIGGPASSQPSRGRSSTSNRHRQGSSRFLSSRADTPPLGQGPPLSLDFSQGNVSNDDLARLQFSVQRTGDRMYSLERAVTNRNNHDIERHHHDMERLEWQRERSEMKEQLASLRARVQSSERGEPVLDEPTQLLR